MTLPTGTMLGPYEILSPIGAGGMGEVYRARDSKLGRQVAIKVLPPVVASSAERLQRFEREAKAVAALNHPNIVTIHAIEQSDGHHYIAMELVEGDSLDRLIPPGGMPLAAIFDIAIPLADALAAAHDKGIVHRDLKPANVMVTRDGRLKVLDFGLAKLTTDGQGGGAHDDATMSAPLTGRGAIIGTVPYMSPEQLQGKPVQHLSDIFSLGVMLYEMAAGTRPFKGESSATVMSAILRDAPRPVQELNSGLPRHLGRIIEHCLEKDPEHRYQSAKDVRNELRALRKELDSGSDSLTSEMTSIASAAIPPATGPTVASSSALSAPTRRGEFWLGVGLIGIILLGGFWYLRSGGDTITSPGPTLPRTVDRDDNAPAIDSLVVLPLENLSHDPTQEYFSDGMTDALISDLGKIGALRVTSRTSAMQYKDTGESISSIARELNVDAALEGSVLRIEDKVRITVQLIEATSERILWGDSYERDVRDILAMQREVARAVAEQIQLELTPAESARLATTRLVNPDAYELYLKGQERIRKRRVDDVYAGLALLEQAIEIDPGFALAHACKADGYLSLVSYDLAPKDIMPQAKAAALKALELDNTSAEAHAALGDVLLSYDWDWDAAKKEYDRALELKPSLPQARLGRANYLTVMGRTDEAMAELNSLYEYDPYTVAHSETFFLLAYLSRRWDKVIEYTDRALGIDPDSWMAHMWRGQALVQLGKFHEAVDEAEKSVAVFEDSVTIAHLGSVYAEAGLDEQAREVLRTLEKMRETSFVCSYRTALIHVGLDEDDRAFEGLSQACEDRSECMPYVNVDVRLDPIRDDARFRDVQACVGLEPEPSLTLPREIRPSPIVLAILPFKNISSDPDTDYLSNELPASLIDVMSKLSGLRVISRSGSFRFDPDKDDASGFAESIGASVVLAGQLNARGDRLTIRAELVDVSTNQQIWSERYRRELSDILTVEEEITGSITEALRLQLTAEDRQGLVKQHTPNPEAYRALLQGRYWHRKFTLPGWRRSLAHFQDAVRIDPQYALGYAELSMAYSALGVWFGDMPPSEAGPKAREAATTAIALDESLGEAYVALGFHLLFHGWDWPGSEEAFQRAIYLSPKSVEAHARYAILLRVMRRFSESEQMLKKAQQLDPTLPMNFVDLAETYTLMGRFDAAADECRRALLLEPQFPPAFVTLGHSYLAQRKYEEAVEQLEKYSLLMGRQVDDLGYLGSAYALAGRRTKALQLLREIDGASSPGRDKVSRARVYAGLGEAATALDLLDQAFDERDPGMIWINTEVWFEPLYDDPRFTALCRGMGFEPVSKKTSATDEAKIMLAVLPFENVGNDSEEEYFSDGMTEEMITRLGRLRPEQLGVIARTSAMRYKNTKKAVNEIGRELGVQYVVEGGVRRSGNTVRISAQLVQVNDQTQLWGDSYTRDLSDVFAIQTDVADAVAQALAVELLPESRASLAPASTHSNAAYNAYLLGRHYWAQRTPESMYAAIDHFQEAVRLDPDYAMAYCGLADTWSVLPWYVPGPYAPMYEEATRAAERALALDDSLAEAHVSMGNILAERGKRAAAGPHFEKAISLDPNNATAHHWYGLVLAFQGRYDAAVREFEQAIALDPLSAVMREDYCACTMAARRFDEAIELCQRALEIHPTMFNATMSVAWAYVGKGELTEAARWFEEYLRLRGQPEDVLSTFRHTSEVQGLQAALREWLDSTKGNDASSKPGPGVRAGMYAWCNRPDEAFECLDRGLKAQDPIVLLSNSFLSFDSLKGDPRWEAFLRKAGLEESDRALQTTTP